MPSSSLSSDKLPLTATREPGRGGGQGLVEYAIILALVSIVVVAALAVLGGGVGNVFSVVHDGFTGPADEIPEEIPEDIGTCPATFAPGVMMLVPFAIRKRRRRASVQDTSKRGNVRVARPTTTRSPLDESHGPQGDSPSGSSPRQPAAGDAEHPA